MKSVFALATAATANSHNVAECSANYLFCYELPIINVRCEHFVVVERSLQVSVKMRDNFIMANDDRKSDGAKFKRPCI